MQIVLFLLLAINDTLFIFYSPDCPHCISILNKIQKNPPSVPYKLFNLESDISVALLSEIEKKLDTFGDNLPVIYFKGKIYYGDLPREFSKGTKVSPSLTMECRKCTKEEVKGMVLPDVPVFIYAPGCRHCSRFESRLKKLLNGDTTLYVAMSTFSSEGLKIISYLKKRGLYRGVPLLLVKDTLLYRLPESRDTLLLIIKNHIKKRSKTFLPDRINFTPTFLTTVFAGLIDGINPCAFTVLLFLIAFLSYRGTERKKSILILIFYSLGIFISYFSIGMGLFYFLEIVNRIPLLNTILRVTIGGIALILGIISFYEAFSINPQKPDSLLALSRKQKVKTHSIIKKYSESGIVAGSFFTGLSISFVEFACTGQIYLPTLSYISRQGGLDLNNLAYLLLYNIFFLLPLLIVGLLAIFIEHKVISKKLSGKIREIKIATGVLFLALFILIVFT